MPTRIYLTAPICVEGPTGTAGEARLHGPQGKLTLAMLALEHRRPVSRDELADELWPDGLPSSHEVSVKVLISKIRTLLREVAPDVRLEGSVGYYDAGRRTRQDPGRHDADGNSNTHSPEHRLSSSTDADRREPWQRGVGGRLEDGGPTDPVFTDRWRSFLVDFGRRMRPPR